MRNNARSLTIKLNGLSISVPESWSVMEAAKANAFNIPSLCGESCLPPGAHCRLCQVEITGRAELALACQTLVDDGLEFLTFSPRVRRARQAALWRILTGHAANCLFCEKSMTCKLKEYCGIYGVSPRKADLRRSLFLSLAPAPGLTGIRQEPAPAEEEEEEAKAVKSGLKLVSSRLV